MLLSKVIYFFKLYFLKRKWRSINRHNHTTIRSCIDVNRVSVGNYSYGALNVLSWGGEERLTIGSLVSIADSVFFILGGNHDISSYTSYPVSSKLLKKNIKRDCSSKGPIIIKDDVWIGYRSLILSGVTLEQGVVVAAGSVVTKSFPAYSVVGGNPARILKFRFSPEIIDELLKVDFGSFNYNKIIQLELSFESGSDIKELLMRLNENI